MNIPIFHALSKSSSSSFMNAACWSWSLLRLTAPSGAAIIWETASLGKYIRDPRTAAPTVRSRTPRRAALPAEPSSVVMTVDASVPNDPRSMMPSATESATDFLSPLHMRVVTWSDDQRDKVDSTARAARMSETFCASPGAHFAGFAAAFATPSTNISLPLVATFSIICLRASGLAASSRTAWANVLPVVFLMLVAASSTAFSAYSSKPILAARVSAWTLAFWAAASVACPTMPAIFFARTA